MNHWHAPGYVVQCKLNCPVLPHFQFIYVARNLIVYETRILCPKWLWKLDIDMVTSPVTRQLGGRQQSNRSEWAVIRELPVFAAHARVTRAPWKHHAWLL